MAVLQLPLFDALQLVADQLTHEERAYLIAALIMRRVMHNLTEGEIGTALLDSPFGTDPFTLRTHYIEQGGRPFLSVTVFAGLPTEPDPKIVAIYTLGRLGADGGDANVHWIYDPAFRETLPEFPALVFDTLKGICEQVDDDNAKGDETAAA